jgi:hypothetical protein
VELEVFREFRAEGFSDDFLFGFCYIEIEKTFDIHDETGDMRLGEVKV